MQNLCKLPHRTRIELERVCRRWMLMMPYHDMRTLDVVDALHAHAGKDMDTLPISSTLKLILERGGDAIERISFGHRHLLITPIAISQLEKEIIRGNTVVELDLSFCKVTENIIPALMPFANRLISLDLGNTVFSIRDADQHLDNLCTLFASMENLASISLQKTNVANFPAIPWLPETLKKANFNGCSPIRPEILLSFLMKCRDLEELRLSTYSNYDETMLDTIFTISKMKILEMSHIAFSDIISHHNAGGFDLSGIANLEKLQELYVQYNNAIDDSALRRICENCLNLRALNLSFCRNITDYRCLHAIAGLQKLWVAASNKFTDIDVINVAQKGKLEVFHATSCDIGSSSMFALADFCPNITELRINQCNQITDEALEKLISACRKLEALSLQASEITDMGMFAIREARLRYLRHLDVSFCRGVGDMGAEALLEFARNRRNGLSLVCYVHQTHVGRSFQALTSESPITFLF